MEPTGRAATPAETIEAIPITVPMPPPPDAGQVVETASPTPAETIEAIPITVPMPPPPDAGQVVETASPTPAETIEAIPITVPMPPAPEVGEVEMGQSVAAPIDLSEPFETESRLSDLTPLTVEETADRSALPEELPEEEEPRG